MTNQGTKKYSLNVDTRILELLGPNLYTNIYYVLAELIANAYDADARNVYIISNKDDIRVEDDGHGMSYNDGEIAKYLNVAGISRTTKENSKTKSGTRHKMGRKGVGKLAALSVSENVNIMTVTNKGEKSGFILERRPPNNGSELKEIKNDEIKFEKVQMHGTAIVMRNPQYRLHKTLDSIKRNLLKIFPLVNQDFKIHIIRGSESMIIEDFDKSMMGELSTLITFGEKFSPLAELVPDIFSGKRNELVETRTKHLIPITMKGNDGNDHEYSLEILGWIGTYKTTRGRKTDVSDFPDNFISLFANEKLGEFNILSSVGQNKLSEVYVIGQLHVDLFELTELPDMSLSNRQGYKSDDPRYEKVREYVRKLLTEVLKKRDLFTDLGKKKKKSEQEAKQKDNEERLKKNVDTFRRSVSEKAANTLRARGVNINKQELERAVFDSIADSSPDLGLKAIVDSQKKKILISQTYPDKPYSDVIYQMLIFNGVSSDEILYTNCDDEICRIPEGRHVYEYLREFFVESYSKQNIFVLFVTSENTKVSWGAITEVGAAWITQVDHKIFNVRPFRPEHPLNDEAQWQSTNREGATQGELWMDGLNADILCQKIEAVCDTLGYLKKNRDANRSYLATLIDVRNLT